MGLDTRFSISEHCRALLAMGQASRRRRKTCFRHGSPSQCTSSLNSFQEDISVSMEPVSSKCGRLSKDLSLFGRFANFSFKSMSLNCWFCWLDFRIWGLGFVGFVLGVGL